jgi:hypothetical protein
MSDIEQAGIAIQNGKYQQAEALRELSAAQHVAGLR